MGIATAIIVGAALAGTAAVASTAIASSGAQKAAKTQARAQEQQIQAQQEAAAKEEATRQEAVARKEQAVADIKFPTTFGIPEAQELKGTLQERIAGRGLVAPVSPLDISKQTAPFAVQRRAGLEKTSAAISSTASARGLGRSTVPVAQIGEQSAAAERDIESRVAALQVENKKIEESNIERERLQKADALARYQDLIGREATSQERKALFERGGEFDIANTIANDASAIRQNEFAIADTFAEQGASQAANQLLNAQIISAGLIGLGETATAASQQIATNDLLEQILNERNTRNAGMVNIAGRDNSNTIRGTDIAGGLLSGRF